MNLARRSRNRIPTTRKAKKSEAEKWGERLECCVSHFSASDFFANRFSNSEFSRAAKIWADSDTDKHR
jgi:hypothetical protein